MWRDYKGVLRENSVPTDFVGCTGFRTPCFRHEDSAHDGGRTVSQSGHLRMVQSGGRAADPRAQTATHRVQAQVEETDREEGIVSIRIRFVAVAGDGHRGDSEPVWRTECGGTH